MSCFVFLFFYFELHSVPVGGVFFTSSEDALLTSDGSWRPFGSRIESPNEIKGKGPNTLNYLFFYKKIFEYKKIPISFLDFEIPLDNPKVDCLKSC